MTTELSGKVADVDALPDDGGIGPCGEMGVAWEVCGSVGEGPVMDREYSVGTDDSVSRRPASNSSRLLLPPFSKVRGD